MCLSLIRSFAYMLIVSANYFLTASPSIVFASETLEINHSCSYFGEVIPKKVHLFASDAEAERVVNEIVSVSGLPRNFKVKAAGVPNASAVVFGQDRLILYNQAFVRNLTEVTRSTWAPYLIMAHEIGHHLAGHTLSQEGSRPAKELEADQYSGFVLQKLGASLDEALVTMKVLAPDLATNTHPARHDRLAATANGWISSCSKDTNCLDNSSNKTSIHPLSNTISENVLKRFGKLLVTLGNPTGRETNDPYIRIMNIKPKYYDEMELALGKEYLIRIDEPGYAPIEKKIVMTESIQTELINLNSFSIADSNRDNIIRKVAALRGVSTGTAEKLYELHEIFSVEAANWASNTQDQIANSWNKHKVYRQTRISCAVVLTSDKGTITHPIKLKSVGYCADGNFSKKRNGRSVYTTQVKKRISKVLKESLTRSMEATLPELHLPPELLKLGLDVGFSENTVLRILTKAIPQIRKYESKQERQKRLASLQSKLLNTITYYR